MVEKITIVAAFYILMYLADMKKLKSASRAGKWSYVAIVLCSLYFSADYLLDVQWPDVNWLAERTLLEPAQAIVKSLKVNHPS